MVFTEEQINSIVKQAFEITHTTVHQDVTFVATLCAKIANTVFTKKQIAKVYAQVCKCDIDDLDFDPLTRLIITFFAKIIEERADADASARADASADASAEDMPKEGVRGNLGSPLSLWTLIDLAEKNERCGIEKAIMILKPTRRECEIIARQASTVAGRIRDALEHTKFYKLASQTTELIHPSTGKKVKVDFGSESSFGEFLSWIPSQGREVCLQLISDPDSMLPISGNWSLFEKDSGKSERWVPKTNENYLQPLNDYWLKTFIQPISPDFDDPIETYYDYPLDGFVSRFPNDFRGRHNTLATFKEQLNHVLHDYEQSIVVLSTEKSAEKHYAQVDKERLAEEKEDKANEEADEDKDEEEEEEEESIDE